MEDLSELKSVLRSLVVSSPLQMTVQALLRDYSNMMGGRLPYTKYGYRDPLAFLKERCADCFLFQGGGGNPVLTPIVPDQLKHIDAFVRKQKIPSNNKFIGKRSSVGQSFLKPSQEASKTFKVYANKSQVPPPKVVREEPRVAREEPKVDREESKIVREEPKIVRKEAMVRREEPRVTREESRVPKEECRVSELSNHVSGDIENIVVNGTKPCTEKMPCKDRVTSMDAYKNFLRRRLPPRTSNEHLESEHTALHNGRTVSNESVRRSSERVQELARTPPARPAPADDPDDALPFVDFDPDVFPADCLSLGDSIPAASTASLQPGDMVELMVGEVYSPSHFWFYRLGAAYHLAMEDMMDEMTAYYSGEGAARVLARGALRAGHYCSSVYERDWHRSLIVRVLDCDTVKVLHVDYGTVERVSAGALKPLLRRWAVLPAQALRARLALVRPVAGGRRWPHSAAAAFLALVRDRPLVGNVLHIDREEDAVELILVDTSGERDVRLDEQLVRAGHAETAQGAGAGAVSGADCGASSASAEGGGGRLAAWSPPPAPPALLARRLRALHALRAARR